MDLEQKKGKRWDHLKLEGGRIEHEWDLGRDSGSRSTALSNLDPHVGRHGKKTEGKAPYLVMAAVVAGLMVLATQGDDVSLVFWGLLPTLFVLLIVVAFRIRSKEDASIIYMKDGSVFAIVRHDWVEQAKREAFLKKLK
ncbi:MULTISPECIES: hypothetical protein [unclassified Lentimonas]|uniref:hypothetical protein n=1 Tax=unclassified Lentimonas TaxID=2630993 RepID=UPI0013268BCD|nr:MULTISPECIES: hypothetical protein [unclassified Lentimonas]CAA6690360.1 Unannotated [Lentimonas sp. CC10]CAA6693066.1 Unannotated [Lentimonas sp. CC19]CAA7069027.1 Unannotated [Lentimonas sp. CC11]